MKTKILILILLSTNYLFSQSKETETENSIYIDLKEYEITKQKVDYIADLNFKNATIDFELEFIPDRTSSKNYYKSSLKGKVKQVTHYMKNSNDSGKKFYSRDLYNEKGLLTESYYTYAGTVTHFYDTKNNIIKAVKIIDGDTVYIKKAVYSPDNKLIEVEQKHFNKEKSKYDLKVKIKYDATGRPIEISNEPSDKTNAYTKEIVYDGNVVKITKSSNSKSPTDVIYKYDSNYNLLYHKYGYHTIFNFYNNNRIIRCMTYRDDAYCCSDFYEYDSNGQQTNWTFKNHLKDHQEVHNYTFKLDSHENVIYEHATENVFNDEREKFMEIEYYTE